MDRLYSSFQIAYWLLQQNITMIGTLQSNRVGIPPEIKKMDHSELNSYEVYFPKKGKKNVQLLSTVVPLLGTTKDDKKKPGPV